MRAKLGAVLVVPFVAFLVIAGAQTGALIGQANVLGEFAEQVGAGREITAVIHELQQERDQTAGELGALGAGRGRRADPSVVRTALEPLYNRSDEAIAQFREVAAPLVDGEASWRVSYDRADDALSRLREIRAAVPAAGLSPDPVLNDYTRVIDALLTLLAEPSPGLDRPALNDAVLRYVQFANVKEISSRARGQLYAAGRAGRYGLEDGVELTDLRAQQLTAIADFQLTATDQQVQRYARAASEPGFVAAVAMEETTISAGDGAALLEPGAWWTTSQKRQDLLRQVEDGVLGDAIDQANSGSADQLNQTLLTGAGVLAVLLVALSTSVLIGRSIARSLRMLRSQALRVAQLELPEALERLRTVDPASADIQVPPAVVRSMDEIGEVAEAFVAVHRSAVSVALEQAVMRRNVNAMFVNLARRSQVLVERQLELLDDLERDEADPDQLENLFKLDHLAARMRRNDDSLLVLAGTEASRRWNRPVQLSTVVLAAVAEIEQYQRIRHYIDDHLHVVGHAVADLVHLVAELLENATAFSRPDTQVRIEGRAQDGGAVIEIIDQGLGMSPTGLEEANLVLATPPAADVAASERMGLFVVSHLAARQRVRVGLRAADRGLVATVRLPANLLAPAPVEEPDRGSNRRLAVMAAVANGSNGSLAGGGPVMAAGSADPMDDGIEAGTATGAMRRRDNPTRAEDVLGLAANVTPSAGSTWWSRQGRGAQPAAPAISNAPPAVPLTGGVKPSGLPIRVPMAQLPVVPGAPAPRPPGRREEIDPEAVGGMLSRYYGGVRRAEAEETVVIPMASTGARNEEEQG